MMIDTNEKVWLIEVNSSPSLARETILDEIGIFKKNGSKIITD